MKYPIAIEPGTDTTAFGVVVPDLPGCFSAGDTLEEALDNAKEAIHVWLEFTIDDGGIIPEATSIMDLQKKVDYQGWIWAIIDVDLSTLSDKTERVNITLPSRILRRIDRDAKAAGESRSSFIARKMVSFHQANTPSNSIGL